MVDKKEVDTEAATDAATEELQTIANEEGKADTAKLHDGREVQIYKCKLRHTAPVASFINTVLMGLNINNVETLGGLEDAIKNPQVLLSTLELAQDDLVRAIDALTDLSAEQVEELDLDDALLVAMRCFEVNQGFFESRVRGVLSGLLERGNKKQKS